MEELSIEEKAKAYDEALERMKSWAKGEHPECFLEAQKAAEFIFPELKEHWDEGERIRKALYADIRTYIPNERGDKYIAWLEKQKERSTEPEWCHHKVDLSNCSEEYRKAYYDGLNNCNMQHSQCGTESNDEDEKIRKALKQGFFEYGNSFTKFGGITVGDIIAWLEKQGKFDKSLYIRFGDIPINGKSKIYNGEIETGIEEGISVYPAFEDKEGNVILGLNLPITKTSLHTQQYLLEYDSRPCYLVTGDYVGKGTDGEPLLKNVRIIKEIKPYRIKQDKENNTYVINNTPNCGISVYNDEELKESEGEMIRKGIIALIEFGLDDKSAIAPGYNITKEEAIAWLERQRDYDRLIEEMKKRKELLSKEKKKATSANDKLSLGGRIAMLQELLAFNICNTTDKVEPKFKVGDWIVDDETPNDVFCVIEVLGEIYKVIDIDGDNYRIPHCKVNKQFHLWTIQDVKDGNVLVNGSNIFIFHFLNDTRLMGYCHVNIDDGRFYDDIGRNECFCLIDAEVSPATKEQHDLLFQKMKDAEYEWDNEKKELSKIVDKSSWSEEDERNLKGIIDEIEANKNSAPDYDLATYDRFLYWLKSLKQRIGG